MLHVNPTGGKPVIQGDERRGAQVMPVAVDEKRPMVL